MKKANYNKNILKVVVKLICTFLIMFSPLFSLSQCYQPTETVCSDETTTIYLNAQANITSYIWTTPNGATLSQVADGLSVDVNWSTSSITNGIDQVCVEGTQTDGCVETICIDVTIETCINPEICNNGIDDDGDGQIDEDCVTCSIDNWTQTIKRKGAPTLCDILLADTTHPLATQDCDGGGIDNLTECQNGDDPTDAADDVTPCPTQAWTSQISGNNATHALSYGGPYESGSQNIWEDSTVQVEYWGLIETPLDAEGNTNLTGNETHTYTWDFDPCVEITQPNIFPVYFYGERDNGLIARDTSWLNKNTAANCSTGAAGFKRDLIFRVDYSGPNVGHFSYSTNDCITNCLNVEMKMAVGNEGTPWFGETSIAYYTIDGGTPVNISLSGAEHIYNECMQPGLYNFKGVLETENGYRASQEWQLLVQ